MIQTETSKAKIIFVSVPNDANNFRISMIAHRIIFQNSKSILDWVDIPQGNWTILNVLDDVTEDEAALIAEIDPEIDFENTATRERLPTYIDYMDDGEYYLSPKNSIKSLATSLGVEGETIIIYELK